MIKFFYDAKKYHYNKLINYIKFYSIIFTTGIYLWNTFWILFF